MFALDRYVRWTCLTPVLSSAALVLYVGYLEHVKKDILPSFEILSALFAEGSSPLKRSAVLGTWFPNFRVIIVPSSSGLGSPRRCFKNVG